MSAPVRRFTDFFRRSVVQYGLRGMMPTALIYLKRPQITASFEIGVTADGDVLRFAGPQLAEVASFLRVTHRVPVFDVEIDGQLYERCHLAGMPTQASICFTAEEITSLAKPTQPRSV